MNYIELVNNSINYIEENLYTKINLRDLSKEFNISQAHFNRVFKFFTGFSIKKYISFRKLTSSLLKLKKSEKSIITIAMDFGYDYPEVFSRAFKKQFGISPKEYRNSNKDIKIEKVNVINKNIVNYNGGLTLKGEYEYIKSLTIYGVRTKANINEPDFFNSLENITPSFLSEKYFHTITCMGDGENFELFHGTESTKNSKTTKKDDKQNISAGWYIKFRYNGNIKSIYYNLRNDIEASFKILKQPLVVSGVGMILKFCNDSPDKIEVMVPLTRI